jgi:hypothetical protein
MDASNPRLEPVAEIVASRKPGLDIMPFHAMGSRR